MALHNSDPHYKQSWRLGRAGGRLRARAAALSVLALLSGSLAPLTVPNTLAVPGVNTRLPQPPASSNTRTLAAVISASGSRVAKYRAPHVQVESCCNNTHTKCKPICALHIPSHFTFSKNCISTHPDDNRTPPLSAAHNCTSDPGVKGLLFQ